MSIAARIRELRKGKSWSLDDLAREAGISKTYLWELEQDHDAAKRPSADVLMRIANALGEPFNDLLGGETMRRMTDVELAALTACVNRETAMTNAEVAQFRLRGA